MKERPIIMSGESVRAILAGRKTQTRRVIKPQPAHSCRYEMNGASPYGVPGDRLWVREGFAYSVRDPEAHYEGHSEDTHDIVYRASAEGHGEWEHYEPSDDGAITVSKVPAPWRSPLFMPRWASRLTLEIIGIRVERVSEISEADCIAEGIEHPEPTTFTRNGFCLRWDSLNAKRGYSWASNPWVWVLEFRRLET